MAGKRTRSETAKANAKATTKKGATAEISQETLRGAVESLLKLTSDHHKKLAQRELNNTGNDAIPVGILPMEQHVFLQMTFKTPPKKDFLRPIPIPLKHTMFQEDDDVIFIVKEPQRALKDYLAENGAGGVTRVLDVGKLRKRYGTYDARRELLGQFDHFLADNRICPMLPSLLGKQFIASKRMPMPVDMRHDIVASIKRTLGSTAFCPRRGTSCSIRIARVGFSADEIIDNVNAVMATVVPRIQDGWYGLQSISVKTNKSPALPVFVTLPSVRLTTQVEGKVAEKRGKANVADSGERSQKRQKKGKAVANESVDVKPKVTSKGKKSKAQKVDDEVIPSEELEPSQGEGDDKSVNAEEGDEVEPVKIEIAKKSKKVGKQRKGKKSASLGTPEGPSNEEETEAATATEETEGVLLEGEAPAMPTPKAKKSKTPKTKTPKTKTPKSKTPKSKTPKSKTPESKTPESKTPESKTPESKTPESKTPESKTPESKTPESKTSKSKTLKVKTPKSKKSAKVEKKRAMTPNTDVEQILESKYLDKASLALFKERTPNVGKKAKQGKPDIKSNATLEKLAKVKKLSGTIEKPSKGRVAVRSSKRISKKASSDV